MSNPRSPSTISGLVGWYTGLPGTLENTGFYIMGGDTIFGFFHDDRDEITTSEPTVPFP
jgi:hypothetical protein